MPRNAVTLFAGRRCVATVKRMDPRGGTIMHFIAKQQRAASINPLPVSPFLDTKTNLSSHRLMSLQRHASALTDYVLVGDLVEAT